MESKLMSVMSKILDKSYTFSDDSILERLHVNLADYTQNEEFSHWKSAILIPWLSEVIGRWNSCKKNIRLFALQVARIVANDSIGTSQLLATNLIDKISDVVKDKQDDLSLMLNYTELVSNVVRQIDGAYWFMSSDVYKLIISEKSLNRSLYLSAQVKELILNAIAVLQRNDMHKCNQLMDRILQPLQLQRTENVKTDRETLFKAIEGQLSRKNANAFGEYFKPINSSTIKLLSSLVKSNSSTVDFCKLLENYDLEARMWTCMSSKISGSEDMISFITLAIDLRWSNGLSESSEKENDLLLMMSYLLRLVFLKEQHCLACRIIMHCAVATSSNRITIEGSPLDSYLFTFFVTPLQPFMDSPTVDSLFSKVGDQPLLKNYSESVSSLNMRDQAELVRSTINNIHRALKIINKVNLKILIRILVGVIQAFLRTHTNNAKEEEDARTFSFNSLCSILFEYKNFLIEVLNIVGTIFKTHIKVNSDLLSDTQMVQHLLKLYDISELNSYAKVRILSQLASIIDLIVPSNDPSKNDEMVESMFHPSSSTLLKNLCNPHWEIRDSAIEILKSMTTRAQKGFPKFYDLILDSNLPSIIYDIAIQDSECYVQISALQCLQLMVQSERIWNDQLSRLCKLDTLLDCLRIVEARVRRDEVSLITEIYKLGVMSDEEKYKVYDQLSECAYDLHWEVKVNALKFWEAVIHRVYEDNNLVDGIFPSDSQVVEQKTCRISANVESKAVLKNILEQLNEIGCLHVLWELNDDCDLEVCRLSASITTNLIDMLKRNHYFEGNTAGESHNSHLHTFKEQNGSSYEPISVGDDELGSETKISEDAIQFIVDHRDIDLLSTMSLRGEQTPEVTEKLASRSKCIQMSVDDYISRFYSINFEDLIQGKENWMEAILSFDALMDTILDVDSNKDQLINVIDCY